MFKETSFFTECLRALHNFIQDKASYLGTEYVFVAFVLYQFFAEPNFGEAGAVKWRRASRSLSREAIKAAYFGV